MHALVPIQSRTPPPPPPPRHVPAWKPPIGFMSASALDIVKSVCASMKRSPGGSAEYNKNWVALQCICPEAASGAAEVLDHKCITRVVARESRRQFHLVEGQTRGEVHTILPGFCTCMYYCINVASKPEAVVCKHELAVLLADSLSLTQQRVIDDELWAQDARRWRVECEPAYAHGHLALTRRSFLRCVPSSKRTRACRNTRCR